MKNVLMDPALAALDRLVARGLVDPERVDSGGVSHGTFEPHAAPRPDRRHLGLEPELGARREAAGG